MAEASFKNLHVLVVDDEPFARKFLIRILGTLGVLEISEAEDGVTAIERMQATETAVDLVICDVEMPNMGGYEFVRQLRFGVVEGSKNVPVLMLTGKNVETNQEKARINKISGFIKKPPDREVMKQNIELALAT